MFDLLEQKASNDALDECEHRLDKQISERLTAQEIADALSLKAELTEVTRMQGMIGGLEVKAQEVCPPTRYKMCCNQELIQYGKF